MADTGRRKAALTMLCPHRAVSLLPVAMVLLGEGVAELSSQPEMSWHLM